MGSFLSRIFFSSVLRISLTFEAWRPLGNVLISDGTLIRVLSEEKLIVLRFIPEFHHLEFACRELPFGVI